MKNWLFRVQVRIACTNYDWAPRWVWFLFISPALGWAIGRGPGKRWWQGWFTFPADDRPTPTLRAFPQFDEDFDCEE